MTSKPKAKNYFTPFILRPLIDMNNNNNNFRLKFPLEILYNNNINLIQYYNIVLDYYYKRENFVKASLETEV